MLLVGCWCSGNLLDCDCCASLLVCGACMASAGLCTRLLLVLVSDRSGTLYNALSKGFELCARAAEIPLACSGSDSCRLTFMRGGTAAAGLGLVTAACLLRALSA